jgi:hypothetical protein
MSVNRQFCTIRVSFAKLAQCHSHCPLTVSGGPLIHERVSSWPANLPRLCYLNARTLLHLCLLALLVRCFHGALHPTPFAYLSIRYTITPSVLLHWLCLHRN